MSKAKSKTKVIALSAVVVSSSVALTSYTVLSNAVNTKVDSSTALNLNINKIDKDTVKISVSNLSPSITSLQLGLKIDGNAKFESQESINWLLKNSGEIQKNINISNSGQYLDMVLVSDEELEKNGSTIDICEIDVFQSGGTLSSSNGYRIVPRTEDNSYAYVISDTNKSKSGNDFINPSEELMKINTAPTIVLKEGEVSDATIKGSTITINEGYDFKANYESFVDVTDEDKDEVKVSYDGKIDTAIAGSYNIKLIATDTPGDKVEIDVVVNVIPDVVTELPTITGVKESHTIYVGEVYSPMENVSAKDAKGNDLEVVLSGDFDLEKPGEYTLVYSAKDKWGNVAKATTKLTVIKDEAPVITGVENKTIEKGDTFDPLEGVKVTDDNDKNIQSKLKVSGEVNTNIAGDYKLSYSVTDSAGNISRAQRIITVKVKDIEAPVINNVPTISGVKDKIIKVGDSFDAKAGISATDKEDGDLTSSIVVNGNVDTSKAGEYKLTYTVEDSKGAKTSVGATITVEKNSIEPPVINNAPIISGVKDQTIEVGENFNVKLGVTATDKEDGDLTDKIKIEGKVDTLNIGEYKLIYLVKDSQGAQTSANATITVVEKETPQPPEEIKPEIPPSLVDKIDAEVVDVISGNGENNAPLILELKKIAVDKLNKFLSNLEDLKPVVEGIYTEGEDTVFKIKLEEKNDTLLRKVLSLFKSNNVYIELKVKTSYTELVERLKKFAEESNTVEENNLPVIFASNITIKVGDKFNPMDNVTASDKEDGDLTSKITVKGNVDTSKVGVYKLTYTVEDSKGGKAELERIITVEENSIEVPGNPETPETPDNEDNDGNDDLVENSIPTITLSDLVIKVGDNFNPMTGVIAKDKEDGDITNKVVVKGNVDTSKVGEYKLTYSVTDSKQATIKVVRTVKVVENIDDYENPKTYDASMVGYISMAALATGGLLIRSRKKNK